jgi:hypothetical protein
MWKSRRVRYSKKVRTPMRDVIAARAPAEFSATVQPECSAEESQAQGGVDLHGLSAGQDGSEERNVADPSAEEDNQTDADGG